MCGLVGIVGHEPVNQALYDALAKEPGQYWFEQAVCASGVTALLVINWQFFLLFYLPTVYLGWCLAHL